MTERELNIELILNRRVYALNGRSIGHLEEIRASMRDGDCVVTDYLVGAYAFFERLAAWSIGRSIMRTLRMKGSGYRVPWNKLDLSDPRRPRLTCPVGELERLEDEGQE